MTLKLYEVSATFDDWKAEGYFHGKVLVCANFSREAEDLAITAMRQDRIELGDCINLEIELCDDVIAPFVVETSVVYERDNT